MFKKGEVCRAEALSQANYQNAMVALQEAGILSLSEASDKKDRKEGKTYSLASDRRAHESLRRRLFRFL